MGWPFLLRQGYLPRYQKTGLQMPTTEYAVTMARYNLWQNENLTAAASRLDRAARQAERGSFFGSIEKTFAHICCGDRIWLGRFAGTPAPAGGISDSSDVAQGRELFCAERAVLDRRIPDWAHGLDPAWFQGDLGWLSGAAGREMAEPKQMLVLHLFNHQTHDRGQIHAMLTAAGVWPGDTDIPLVPARFSAL